MAHGPEKAVKAAVVKVLKKYGCYYFFAVMAGYGSSGIPDIIACYKGQFIAIECKAGKNTPTALQEKNLTQIAEAKGYALVINEDNLHVLEMILNEIGNKYPE